LNLTDWQQLKALSQRQRRLVLKVSGYSDDAWGARGVYVGSDLSRAEWSTVVDRALARYSTTPFVLQQFAKAQSVNATWFDTERDQLVTMRSRVRLSPYYFFRDDDVDRPILGGALATMCPADKKIIHGMTVAIMAPCAVEAR
jgi:hypothetical protein